MANAFTVEDCALFQRYPNRVRWSEVAQSDKEAFKSVRDRLKDVASRAVANVQSSVPFKAFAALYEANGRSVTDVWCCVHPTSIENKSYALQVALIISARGAEMCFCVGAGDSQTADPEARRSLESKLTAAKEKLRDIPRRISEAVQNSLIQHWFYHRSWKSEPTQQDFNSLTEWLAYASTPAGNKASVSAYFTPEELEAAGESVSERFDETLELFKPLLEYVYGPPTTSKGFWIFQGNPRLFGVDEYIRTRDEIVWSVRQHADLIHKGDMALIWRSGENAGVVAVCLVQSEPDPLVPDDAPEIWHQKPPETEMRCKLKLLERFLDHPISREAIGTVLPKLNIIKAPQGTNFALTEDEYAKILSLRNQQPESGLAEILRRYYDEQIIFVSSVQNHRYAIAVCDDTGVSVERLDAHEPQRVTFAQAEKLFQRVQDAGELELSSLDSTVAVRSTIVQAEPLALTADKKRVRYLPDKPSGLQNFIEVLGNLNIADPLYKPAMLLCVLEGIESGELSANRIPFDWIALRFIAKLKTLGRDVTVREAAQPFYHLTGDLIWLHAVPNRADLMQDGADGPAVARRKIKYALLKDTYWNLLQDAACRSAVRRQLETIMAPKLSPDQLLSAAESAVANTGFVHSPGLVRRFISSILSKPFVILTGNSGTGKTKLAQLIAHWMTGSVDGSPVGYTVVPVGADWTDNRNVVGFVNHLRKDGGEKPIYQSTPVLDLLLRALADSSRPYFLILDEMNLSHVERYFSDFLSAMESKTPFPIHQEKEPLLTPSGATVRPSVDFPENLFVAGTVNVDETTYMFSPKVLDRAYVLEFRIDPEQAKGFVESADNRLKAIVPNPEAARAFLELSRRARGLTEPALPPIDEAALAECQRSLQDLFAILHHARLEFAFRTLAEVMRYLRVDFALSARRSDWHWQRCLDAQILPKILPKLHGSRRRLEGILIALATYCEKRDADASQKPLQRDSDLNAYPSAMPLSEVQFPLSRAKLVEMIEAVRRDQFVSFIQ